MVYEDRAKAKNEVFSCIKAARVRVWIMGIAFSEEIKLSNILSNVGQRITQYPEFDVRILLMDVLRSPAVFRAFLESSPSQVKDMLSFDRKELPPNLDPYKQARMFVDFSRVYALLRNDYSHFRKYVKYYGQNPNCWMVLIDDTVFYQPYTFGRGDIPTQQKQCIGALMPVFKFEKKESINTFKIMEDHFSKIWLTSNHDMFHITARLADSDATISKIFEDRQAWLWHVYGSLYLKKHDTEKRRSSRICQTRIYVTIDKIKESETDRLKATVINYSAGGLGVEVPDGGTFFEKDVFSVCGLQTSLIGQHKYAIEQLVGKNDQLFDFKVIWTKIGHDGITRIGASRVVNYYSES